MEEVDYGKDVRDSDMRKSLSVFSLYIGDEEEGIQRVQIPREIHREECAVSFLHAISNR